LEGHWYSYLSWSCNGQPERKYVEGLECMNLSLDTAVLIANNGSYLLSLSKAFVKGGEVDPNYSFFT
jgi:hypothetical protein